MVQIAERLSRGDYFAAAMAILAEDGVAGLTTTRLCQRLEVTRGSLYHHFESGPAFHDALIEHWDEHADCDRAFAWPPGFSLIIIAAHTITTAAIMKNFHDPAWWGRSCFGA